uniref:Uncharacterized protein n=1 Tax=Oryza meridionalis TaxID=40149 RepID=A0A0E0C7J8_9ORYZ
MRSGAPVVLAAEDDGDIEAVRHEQLAELHRGDQVADHPRRRVDDSQLLRTHFGTRDGTPRLR